MRKGNQSPSRTTIRTCLRKAIVATLTHQSRTDSPTTRASAAQCSAMYITASAAYAAGRPCPEDDHAPRPPPHPHAVQRTPKCCRPCSCPVTRSFMLCTEMSMTASLCVLPVITVSLCCSSTGGSLQTSSQRTASVGSLHTETRPGTLCWASMIYYGCVVCVFITCINYL